MSLKNSAKTESSTEIPYEEQQRIILAAIEQRYPGVNFREWPYHEVGSLLNTNKMGVSTIAHYQHFFTDLLLFIGKHGLTTSFCEEMDDPLGIIENLSRFFFMLAESAGVYEAFVDHYNLSVTRVDEETMTGLAMDYLYGPERDRIIKANEEK